MNMDHTVTLITGCKGGDGKGAAHREVTFGKRPTVADLIRIEADSQSAIDVQNNLLHVKAAVTKIGTLPRVMLSSLLQLDETDREILFEGFADFLRAGLGERTAEELSAHSFKLVFGVEVEGETYDIIEFTPEPPPLTGFDEVKLERRFGSGSRKELALMARETVKLAQSEGALEIEGEVSADALERLDADDFGKLREFFTSRRDSFRRSKRGAVAGGVSD